MKKKPLEWQTVRRKVNDLLPYERNPRQISDKQLSDLRHSIETFNLVELPAIDLDNRIVAGHQRLRVLQILGRGREKIEVRIPNRKLTKEEFEQYLITSNAVGGGWDFEKLKSFEIDTLLAIGFDETQLSRIWDEMLETEDDGFDVDAEIKKIRKPKSKLGDLLA